MAYTGYSPPQQITIAPFHINTDITICSNGHSVTFDFKDKLKITTDLLVDESAQVILSAFTDMFDNEMKRLKDENMNLKREIIKVKIHNFETILEDILK